MSVYIGIKTIHNFGYQKFPPYYYATNMVSASLSVVTRFIPPEIERMVYKIIYLVLSIVPKLTLISIPSLAFAYKKKDIEGFSQALFGAITMALFDMLVTFYPYDVLTNLNVAYQRKKLPPAVLDQAINSRVVTHLQAGNSIILHGPTGCGKSSAIRALVKEIEEGRCRGLQGKTIYSLDLAQLLSNPNSFLENLTALLLVVKQSPHAILFIDEIQRLTERIHGVKVADVLKLYLEKEGSQGKNLFVQMIGATTTEELSKIDIEDVAFSRRFFPVEVGKETNDTLIKQMISTHFANKTNMLSEEAITKAIETSEEYYPRIALPARAIKILEAVYAMKKETQSKTSLETADIETAIQKGLIQKAKLEGKRQS